MAVKDIEVEKKALAKEYKESAEDPYKFFTKFRISSSSVFFTKFHS